MSKINISSKLPSVQTSIFTVMSRLANKHQAINLSQGFPNFDTPDALKKLVSDYMQKGFNQYAPMAGVMSLREQLAAKIETLYGTAPNPETDITITAGATQAIYTAMSAFVRRGDEVIVFEPAYDCYTPAIQLHGGKPVYVPLKAPDYGIPWEQLEQAISPKTRMIIFNNPHNPTAYILTDNDLQKIRKIIKYTNILLLSDEVYEHITFDGQAHQSFLKYPDLVERTVATYSFGKTFHNTGWKIGYCVAPAALMAEFRKVHQFLVFSVNTPVQYALADFLKNADNYTSLPAFYQQKRDFFLEKIKGSRFKWQASGGSYFQLLDYSAITAEKDTDFAVRLTKELGVAAIPISVFYHDHLDEKMLRFCFAKTEETLAKAGELLCRI